MTHHEVDLLIGRAITDHLFRETLLHSPHAAILEFPLTREERDLLTSIQAGSLEDLAQQLFERMETSYNGHQSPNGSGSSPAGWDGLAA